MYGNRSFHPGVDLNPTSTEIDASRVVTTDAYALISINKSKTGLILEMKNWPKVSGLLFLIFITRAP